MMAAVRRLATALLELAAPPECMACETCGTEPLCAECRALIVQPAPRSLDGVPAFAALDYAPPFDRVIQRFKYENRPDLARGLAALVPRDELSKVEILVPVPLHPRRLAERGYNQAALLAGALAEGTAARVRARALARVRDTPRQALLSRAERMQNVATAFRVRLPNAIAGRRVVLIDDVVTTGATASACIRALRRAGAQVRAVLAAASAAA